MGGNQTNGTNRERYRNKIILAFTIKKRSATYKGLSLPLKDIFKGGKDSEPGFKVKKGLRSGGHYSYSMKNFKGIKKNKKNGNMKIQKMFQRIILIVSI